MAFDHFLIVESFITFTFSYLDRHHAPREKLPLIDELCRTAFYALVFVSNSQRVLESVLELLSEERYHQNNLIREMIRRIGGIYRAMGERQGRSIYVTSLELHVLAQADSLYSYSKLINRKDAQVSLPMSYLKLANHTVQSERCLIEACFSHETAKKMQDRLHAALILKPFDMVLMGSSSGFKNMLALNQYADISFVYELYADHPACIDSMAAVLQSDILDKGAQIIPSDQFVSDLIRLHSSGQKIISSCFVNSIRFHRSLHEALGMLMRAENCAQLLVSFIRTLVVNRAAESSLDQFVDLLSCLGADVDLFVVHYRTDLAYRLVQSLTVNRHADLDIALIAKLHARFGSGFTHRLDTMIADIITKPSLTAPHPEVSLNFTVLTTGCWPSQMNGFTMALPQKMLELTKSMEAEYASQTVGRRLRWDYRHGQCTVTRGGSRFLVSPIQCAILLLFNDNSSLEIRSLISILQLAPNHVKHSLKYIVTGKYQVLEKVPFRGYSLNDVLRINQNFDCEGLIVIPGHFAADFDPSSADVKARQIVDEDRKHVLDAIIVRIMKTHRRYPAVTLVAGVIEHLRKKSINPIHATIVARIDDLVLREYLHRDLIQNDILIYNTD